MIIDGAERQDALREAIAGTGGHFADVTGALVRFAVSRSRSRALLSQGCSLDLRLRTFRMHTCARSSFAQSNCLLDRVEDGDLFHLYAEASLSHHLTLWLADASGEGPSES
ncbi:sarcosine oxidase subunit gamma family protein [Sphingomonas glacialis]|uniref:Uncharacterized protein n=1 Tax=Sphingomonas glacialis TaxID=658225 RepID=A0A502FRY6_9SPHN|nr:sarcosine oxidase subunit gamma family protein [Sphingomonas glacialis]TPG52159.1 hypothetical protein EAH76_15760 [Sphingomonas glacialis]